MVSSEEESLRSIGSWMLKLKSMMRTRKTTRQMIMEMVSLPSRVWNPSLIDQSPISSMRDREMSR